MSTGSLLLRAAGAGEALLTSSLLLGLEFGVRPPFEMFADRFTLLLPPPVFDSILVRLQFWSKPLLLLSLAGLWVPRLRDAAALAALSLT